LQKWDTSGYEAFRAVTTAYCRGAHDVVIAFELPSEKASSTFSLLRRLHAYNHLTMSILLIGDKCDLVDEREVSTEEAREYAHERAGVYDRPAAWRLATVWKDTARGVVTTIRFDQLDVNMISLKATAKGGLPSVIIQ
jgi:GTPase SAR1 family protein